jgi:hypothetical protein
MDVVDHRFAGLVEDTGDIEGARACFHDVVGAPDSERVAQSRRRANLAGEKLVTGARYGPPYWATLAAIFCAAVTAESSGL